MRYLMAEKYRKSGCLAKGNRRCHRGHPTERKDEGRGVVEEPEHLTGEHRGFHTSCGQLFRLVPEFIPRY